MLTAFYLGWHEFLFREYSVAGTLRGRPNIMQYMAVARVLPGGAFGEA